MPKAIASGMARVDETRPAITSMRAVAMLKIGVRDEVDFESMRFTY
jgi:hypothetical protein